MPALLLWLGVFACSTSVLWIKASGVDALQLTGWRLLLGALALTPWFVRDWRRHRGRMTLGHVRDSAAPGVMLAIHLVTWIYGARETSAANATLIVNLVPLAMPLLLLAAAGEWPNRREWLATSLAFAALAVLFAADYQVSPEHLLGDAVCLGSMFLLAAYMAMGRRYRHHPTTCLYVTPLYYAAALVAFAAVALVPVSLFSSSGPINWRKEWLWIGLLALLPTILGHSLINNAMRHFRGQVVAIATMGQFIFAAVLAYFWPGETPHWSFLPASLLVIAAAVVAFGGEREASSDEG